MTKDQSEMYDVSISPEKLTNNEQRIQETKENEVNYLIEEIVTNKNQSCVI